MNILFVVAHPDDEVLGAGATIHRLIKEGHRVAIATMVSQAEARADLSPTLLQDQARAHAILGVHKAYPGDFPNIQMNVVPHLELVQYIEDAIEDWGAESIFTHHPSDVNIDHSMTSHATQAAVHLFQRRSGIPALRQFAYMEVLSSTEWSLDSSVSRFTPNYFVEIGEEGLALKLRAAEAYARVMRPYPHPRSLETITGLAACRGSQAGCHYAEAFEQVFARV